MQLSITEFSILLGNLKEFYGKDIVSIRDCTELSDDILLKTKDRISPSTIFRWYVLNNQSHKPYQNTLNTLQTYLSKGENVQSTDFYKGQCIFPDHQGLEFISLSLQHAEYKGFLSYLKKMPTAIENIEQSIHFAGRIGKEIRNSALLQKQLIPELIKTEQGRLYIIELFCDEDFLDGYFKEALEQYITVYPNKHQKKVLEDFIFASHLLSFSYLLRKEFDNLSSIHREFEAIVPKVLKIYEKLHPMPRLRFHLMNALCNRLLFKLHTNLEHETILHVENLVNEFPLWRNVLLFELSKTAAILDWKDCLEYISSKLSEHKEDECMTGTFHYKPYIAEILHRFGKYPLQPSIPFSGSKPIEYTRYNSHIIRIKETLNKLK